MLSVAPAWGEHGLTARRVALRVYLVATETGYQLMPGGLTRVAGETSGCQNIPCAVSGRRFDSRGSPLRSVIAGSSDQFNFNQGGAPSGASLRIATNANAVTMAVWNGGDSLYLSALDWNGALLTMPRTIAEN